MIYSLPLFNNFAAVVDLIGLVFMGRGDRGVVALGREFKALARGVGGDPEKRSGPPKRQPPSGERQTAVVIIGGLRSQERIVLQQAAPGSEEWSLPTRALVEGEQLLEAAQKSLAETGVESAKLSELGEYGNDGGLQSTVYLARMRLTVPLSGDNGQAMRWFKVADLPKIHPDSQQMVADALARLA